MVFNSRVVQSVLVGKVWQQLEHEAPLAVGNQHDHIPYVYRKEKKEEDGEGKGRIRERGREGGGKGRGGGGNLRSCPPPTSDMFLSARLHALKVLQISQTVPPTKDQVFNPRRLWGTFLTQTTKVSDIQQRVWCHWHVS